MRWRRRGLLGAALIAAVIAVAQPGAAQTVKVGAILTLSGPQAQIGDEMQKAIKLYVKLHEKELPPGVKLEVVTRDDTGPNPDVAKRLAQELITRDHVQLLAGIVFSPNATAVAPLTAEAKVPFVDMNAAGVNIPRLSPYVVRFSFTLWQIALPMGQWAAKRYKTGYVAVSDFIPGHDAQDAFTKGFTDGGGKILGTIRFPLISPNFVPVVQRIKDAKPQCAFVFVPAAKQATAFVKAWSDLGLKDAGVNLVTTQDVMVDDELPNMGDAPLGIVSTGNYSIAAKRPQNEAFLAAWHREYGAASTPTFFSVGSWDGMAAIFGLIKATKGKFTADQAMAFFAKWKDDNSPRGPIAIDPKTRDIVQNVYLRRVEKVDGKPTNVEIETFAMQKDPWKELNPAK
jgi:branched-chain amino acid transport system substrate-binding protein